MRLVHVHYWIGLFGLHSLFQTKRRLHRVHRFLRSQRAFILLQLYDLFTLTVFLGAFVWQFVCVFVNKIKLSEHFRITLNFHSPRRGDDFLHLSAHV